MRKQSRLQGAWRGQDRGCWESWEQPVSSPHQGLVWFGRWQGAREGSRTGGTWLGGHLGRWTQREMGEYNRQTSGFQNTCSRDCAKEKKSQEGHRNCVESWN